MGSLSFGLYWRLVMLLGLGALEVGYITGSLNSNNDPISLLIYWRSPAERIEMARQLYIVSSIALNQIGPMIFPQDKRSTRDLILELEASIFKEYETAKAQLNFRYLPFSEDGKGPGPLKTKLEQYYVEKILENDPEFRLAQQQFFAEGAKSAANDQ